MYLKQDSVSPIGFVSVQLSVTTFRQIPVYDSYHVQGMRVIGSVNQFPLYGSAELIKEDDSEQ